MQCPDVKIPKHALSMDRGRVSRLLHQLDAAAEHEAERFASRRGHVRCHVREFALFSLLKHNRVDAMFFVPVRNVSNGGAAFLHRCMLHNGETCALQFHLRDGTWIQATGKVVRCRHIEQMVHEIGIQFDTPIVLPGTPREPTAEAPPATPRPQ